jgi:excisionase family DNA binding protein
MPRRPAHHRVKSHLVYTVAEAAEVVDVHKQTIGRWIRDDGLPAETDRRPHLIRGADLKRFLQARRDAGRVRLRPGEFYCLPCRRPRRPDGSMADYRARTALTGILIGLCPCCGRTMHRIARRADLARIAAGLDVAFR